MCGISVRVQVPPWVKEKTCGRVAEWLIVVVLKTVAERPRVQIPPRPFYLCDGMVDVTYLKCVA